MNDKTWRVKLYELSSEGQWEDLGIGEAKISDNFFEIFSEDDNTFLLGYQVGDEVYSRQDDSIITISYNNHCTYAVSFQDPVGAQITWENFLSIQGRDPNIQKIQALPQPNEENLTEVIEILSDLNASNRANNTQAIINDGFIRKLSQEFQLSKSKENKEILEKFFLVYKILLQFSDNSILEDLLSDENFFSFIGAMDYDPSVKCTQYLQMFKNDVKFINPLNITDKDFLAKIHAAFRLGFLKESQSSRGLEESTVYFLSSYQIYEFNEIISCFIDSGNIRASLILKLKAKDFNSVLFFYELINIAKSANIAIRSKFYDTIVADDILEIIEENWSKNEWTEEQKIKFRGMVAEFFLGIMQISPFIMKQFFYESCKKSPDIPFLADFCKEMINSPEISSLQLIGEFLRNLLDGDEDQSSNSLYEILYDTVLYEFIKKFSADANIITSSRDNIFEILSILSQCVQSHSCRIRYFLIFHEVIQKVVSLLEIPDNPLKIAILRFFRTVIEKNDQFINRFIISRNCFAKIFQVFIDNGEKENMVFHSILALFESIRKTNSPSLIEHVITKHVENIENVKLKSCFEDLINAFDKQKSQGISSPNSLKLNPTELASDESFSSPLGFESDEENEKEFKPMKRKCEGSEDEIQKRFKGEISEEFMI
ncbi:unnamed protein product [Blepharisma stoltei]|uniref:Serine/threonine-protein phosphatase 4 regulatory subunit 3-like central domain-containing protein n=1 Tax=Blepharisma stoltei TaxID=1481888 RepID=A0AAU9J7L0_9CILI|nr:unnamed protein product [Blepharisma stoltei]